MKLPFKKPAPPPGRRRVQVSEQSTPAAFSYYARRSDTPQNTGRDVAREPAAARPGLWRNVGERAGLLVLLIAIIAGTINSLTLSTNPNVEVLNKSDISYLHPISDYNTAASSILAGSLWNHNKLTFNSNKVARQLKNQFPELASVSITLPLLAHRPIIYLQPSPPVLILSTTNNASFVIGQNGQALLNTAQLPSSSQLDLPVITDQTGLTVKTGTQALSSTNVAFIQTVLAELKAANIAVSNLVLPPAASELDVHLPGQPYYVKFNTHAPVDDALQQAGTFLAVKKKLDSEHITPAQYIDVRVDGRAYYK